MSEALWVVPAAVGLTSLALGLWVVGKLIPGPPARGRQPRSAVRAGRRRPGSVPPGGRVRGGRPPLDGQLHREHGAAAGPLARGGHAATVGAGDGADDRQPHA